MIISLGNKTTFLAARKASAVVEALKKILKANKMKYQNRKEVRSWLSETEVAEYWYTVEDMGFWRKIFAKVASLMGVKVQPTKRLKCAIWSPFRGDKLYPFYDETGDMVAFRISTALSIPFS